MASVAARPTVQNCNKSEEAAPQHGLDLGRTIFWPSSRTRCEGNDIAHGRSRSRPHDSSDQRQPEWIVPVASARAGIDGLVRSSMCSLEVHERHVLGPSSCVARITTRPPCRLERPASVPRTGTSGPRGAPLALVLGIRLAGAILVEGHFYIEYGPALADASCRASPGSRAQRKPLRKWRRSCIRWTRE
jgi:hypothetical protein